jgi:hypothetical protein
MMSHGTTRVVVDGRERRHINRIGLNCLAQSRNERPSAARNGSKSCLRVASKTVSYLRLWHTLC